MNNMINVDDLITFSDGLKVLVMGKYEYGESEHDKAEYLLVKQVNETETMTIGNAFFLKINRVGNAEDFDCEYIRDDKLIYALMSVIKQSDSCGFK